MTIGDKISTLRKQNNMTQEELANKLSVTPQAVSKWENGITSPDISLLGAIATLFHISTDELLGIEAPKAYAAVTDDISKLMLKIHVNSNDGDRVNVNLPLAIATSLLDSGAMVKVGNDKMKDIDWKAVLTAVQSGLRGKIVDIVSSDGDTVEVVVE